MSLVSRFWVFATVLGVLASITAPVYGEVVPPGTEAEIRERLQPFGSLCRIGDACSPAATSQTTTSGTMTGEQVYNQFCFACHATGVSESPILGDTEAWAPRLAKGMDTLWESTTNGLNLMPIRGTCMNCSDDELREAMNYVMGQTQ